MAQRRPLAPLAPGLFHRAHLPAGSGARRRAHRDGGSPVRGTNPEWRRRAHRGTAHPALLPLQHPVGARAAAHLPVDNRHRRPPCVDPGLSQDGHRTWCAGARWSLGSAPAPSPEGTRRVQANDDALEYGVKSGALVRW